MNYTKKFRTSTIDFHPWSPCTIFPQALNCKIQFKLLLIHAYAFVLFIHILWEPTLQILSNLKTKVYMKFKRRASEERGSEASVFENDRCQCVLYCLPVEFCCICDKKVQNVFLFSLRLKHISQPYRSRFFCLSLTYVVLSIHNCLLFFIYFCIIKKQF